MPKEHFILAKRNNEFHSKSIGFTDFEEGRKSEIFRRCDAGASPENVNIIFMDFEYEVTELSTQ